MQNPEHNQAPSARKKPQAPTGTGLPPDAAGVVDGVAAGAADGVAAGAADGVAAGVAAGVASQGDRTSDPSGYPARYLEIREATRRICAGLKIEDQVVQPVEFVSPPKWHLAHSTWFFETFLLAHKPGYRVFDPAFDYLFNSYYESVGRRVPRNKRGELTRPTVTRVLAYREHVDEAMAQWLEAGGLPESLFDAFELGLQHEQQHQELLWTDLQYILASNPLKPGYDGAYPEPDQAGSGDWITLEAGVREVGHAGGGFCFDNELPRHKTWVTGVALRDRLVSNAEYLEFMEDGGYRRFEFWLSEAWAWIQQHGIRAPLYWFESEGFESEGLKPKGVEPDGSKRDADKMAGSGKNGRWLTCGLAGVGEIDPEAPVRHISYYEAEAFARWKGLRLPTETEWEAAAPGFAHGQLWEWCASAYLPYPGYRPAGGALGEYNGKFMINQMVLRGGSVASPAGHVRDSYRNFFPADARWQFSGIRLARDPD